MPIGVFINFIAIVAGGALGCLLKSVISDRLKQSLTVVLAFCAMTLGLCSLIKLQSLTLVILAILLGTIVGELLGIYDKIQNVVSFSVGKLSKKKCGQTITENSPYLNQSLVASAVIIFCFSGTGIFGAITEGMSGDSSVLIAKSVLDIFTAMIIATSIGKTTMFLAIPQLIIMTTLFFLADFISPIMTENVSANFIAVGGLITIMTGFNLLKLKEIRLLNTLPSLVLIIIFSLLAF